jgi:hypothetical protein
VALALLILTMHMLWQFVTMIVHAAPHDITVDAACAMSACHQQRCKDAIMRHVCIFRSCKAVAVHSCSMRCWELLASDALQLLNALLGAMTSCMPSSASAAAAHPVRCLPAWCWSMQRLHRKLHYNVPHRGPGRAACWHVLVTRRAGDAISTWLLWCAQHALQQP